MGINISINTRVCLLCPVLEVNRPFVNCIDEVAPVGTSSLIEKETAAMFYEVKRVKNAVAPAISIKDHCCSVTIKLSI